MLPYPSSVQLLAHRLPVLSGIAHGQLAAIFGDPQRTQGRQVALNNVIANDRRMVGKAFTPESRLPMGERLRNFDAGRQAAHQRSDHPLVSQIDDEIVTVGAQLFEHIHKVGDFLSGVGFFIFEAVERVDLCIF